MCAHKSVVITLNARGITAEIQTAQAPIRTCEVSLPYNSFYRLTIHISNKTQTEVKMR